MMQVSVFGADGVLRQGGSELLNAEGTKWIDVEAPTAEVLEGLAGPFGLHKLAIEDCLHLDQRPKLEEYPNHLFLVIHGFTAAAENVCELELQELHIFLAKDWVITVHERPLASIQHAGRRIAAEPTTTLGRGPDFVAYLVADALVDQNFPLLERFSDELEELEVHIFEAVDKQQLMRIFELKRALVELRRVLSPQRDVVGLLSRRGIVHIQERTTLYFRDIYDHLVRLYEQIDSNRDLLGNTMDGYLSMMANRTNEITKQLTIFATIFLPLSFITGFFGQNFDVLSGKGFLYLMLFLVFSFPVLILTWVRRNGWS